MTTHQLVKKVIGPINPIGQSSVDLKRFENLHEMTNLVESLLSDIDDIIYNNSDAKEYSVKKSVDFAKKFMQETVINIAKTK